MAYFQLCIFAREKSCLLNSSTFSLSFVNRVCKSNSQSCCTDRRKFLFHFMFSSCGNCDKLLPQKFSVLTHHLWTCQCSGTSLWSGVCRVTGLSLNYTPHPSLSVKGGRCLWKTCFWLWHEWLPKHVWMAIMLSRYWWSEQMFCPCPIFLQPGCLLEESGCSSHGKHRK